MSDTFKLQDKNTNFRSRYITNKIYMFTFISIF